MHASIVILAPLLRRWGRLTRVVGLALALGGCAGLSTRVTNFNAWPADAQGARFAFRTPAGVTAGLEQATYEGHVRAELERQGLVAASAGAAARFQVEVTASQTSSTRSYLQPVYVHPQVFVPPFRDRLGRVHPGYWAHDPFGPRYAGSQPLVVTLNLARLQVRITDTAGGAPRPVFESSAVYEGERHDLPQLVPYLARAVFEGFPGTNGQVRTVRFDLRSGEIRR